MQISWREVGGYTNKDLLTTLSSLVWTKSPILPGSIVHKSQFQNVSEISYLTQGEYRPLKSLKVQCFVQCKPLRAPVSGPTH